MVCMRCNEHTGVCQCPDIEDRLRELMKTGNAQARHWAREALFERLSRKRITADEIDDEMLEVLEWSINREWAKKALLN